MNTDRPPEYIATLPSWKQQAETIARLTTEFAEARRYWNEVHELMSRERAAAEALQAAIVALMAQSAAVRHYARELPDALRAPRKEKDGHVCHACDGKGINYD